MTKNSTKNISLIIASGFLLAALFDVWQYGFFTILRFVVFSSTAYVAYLAYQEQKEAWVWILGSVAVLFNPFIPVHLTRELWMPIDLIVAISLVIATFLLKLDPNRAY